MKKIEAIQSLGVNSLVEARGLTLVTERRISTTSTVVDGAQIFHTYEEYDNGELTKFYILVKLYEPDDAGAISQQGFYEEEHFTYLYEGENSYVRINDSYEPISFQIEKEGWYSYSPKDLSGWDGRGSAVNHLLRQYESIRILKP